MTLNFDYTQNFSHITHPLKLQREGEECNTPLEEISFTAGGNDYPVIPVKVDEKYVEKHLEKIVKNRDLKKYVL